MSKTINELKQHIRAGRGLIPAHTVISGGTLVNVMTSEVYPADVAIYEGTIVCVGDVSDYIDLETKIIDASGMYIVPGLIDGHIHSECSKLSITSFAKAVVPCGTASIISGLDEYISVSGLAEVQKWPECFGVWETVREFLQEEDEDALGAILEVKINRLPIFGCAPMARGKDLNGYLCGGIRLDHESYDHEEGGNSFR